MNIFYAPPEYVTETHAELRGQEARHASKVLRYREGDEITVVNGEGGWYEGIISKTGRDYLGIEIKRSKIRELTGPRLTTGVGLIKKRDRLEYALEKAVELGASDIALFRSEHTVKESVRRDRLESIILSAMKQSLRAYLPSLELYDSLPDLLERWKGKKILAAHPDGENGNHDLKNFGDAGELLLLVGPEGGFSETELSDIERYGGAFIALGQYRLRSETAVVALMSQFL